LIANTVATIAVGLGAVEPAFGNVTLTDAAGRLIKNSADRPVPILQAPAEAIRASLLRALPTREGEMSFYSRSLPATCMISPPIRRNSPRAISRPRRSKA
jgi:hypothetical protein